MATHSSILTWRIPWTEGPSGLQSMGSQRHTIEQLTHTHTHTWQDLAERSDSLFPTASRKKLNLAITLTLVQ